LHIINISLGYGLSGEDLSTNGKETLTYHRIIEAFKFAFAEKIKQGDPDFIENDKLDVEKVSLPIDFYYV